MLESLGNIIKKRTGSRKIKNEKKNYFPGHMVLYTENPKNSTNTRIYGSTTGFLDTWINIEKLIFLYSTAA